MKERSNLLIALLVLNSSINVRAKSTHATELNPNSDGLGLSSNSIINSTQPEWTNDGSETTKRPTTTTSRKTKTRETSSSRAPTIRTTTCIPLIHKDVKAMLVEMGMSAWIDSYMEDNIDPCNPRSTGLEWTNDGSETTKRPTTITQETITRTTTYIPPILIEINNRYGNIFGRNKLTENTYIAKNNYFEKQPPLGPGPLAKALFSRGYERASSGPYDTLNNRIWNKYIDSKWRETTRAPYFENKVPGEEKIIPASAVIGAATAFGLVSLLPLEVPRHKPLMYCGNTNLNQLPIGINNGNVYVCNQNSFEIICPDNFRNQIGYQCMNKKIQCDLKYDAIQGNIYCRNETLFSKTDIICSSTSNVAGRIETMTILECIEGQISKELSSYIPTTTPSPYILATTTTQKPLSFGAKAHLFMLKLMGKFDVLEEETATAPVINLPSRLHTWYPEPLTIPPETMTSEIQGNSDSAAEAFEKFTTKSTTSTTTMASYEWWRTVSYPNNDTRLEPLPKQLVEMAEKLPRSEIPANWIKVLMSNRLKSTTSGS